MISDANPAIMNYYPLVFLLGIPIGCSAVNFSLYLIERTPPPFLARFAVLGPAVLLVLIWMDLIEPQRAGALIASPIFILGVVVAALIAAWGALFEKRVDAGLIAGPVFLVGVYVFRDLIAALGFLSGNTMFSPSLRIFVLSIITIVLLHRLAVSLNKLDKNEEVLVARLEDQEAELNAYFDQEQEYVKQDVVVTERRRLIRDLHDGMGGHLVSILALSEDGASAPEDVQGVARRALDDLRMVIYSLDTESSDLAYALALYRERLLPVLESLNIQTHWSIADLPEIDTSGPSSVLAVLRILQEAVTNAQKHGEPREIRIFGQARDAGTGLLIVENRGGKPYTPGDGTGFGLENIYARAQSIGGQVIIESLEDGTRLTLTLPKKLLALSST